MEAREIKETKEVVVRTEYVAMDGEVFRSEDECKKYEDSALFAVKKQLKRLQNKELSQYDLNDDCCDELEVEIFNAENETDIENIRKYVYLKSQSLNGKVYPNSIDLPNITCGHEVIIWWNYDHDSCWTYGNGSIEDYINALRDRITKLITPKEECDN